MSKFFEDDYLEACPDKLDVPLTNECYGVPFDAVLELWLVPVIAEVGMFDAGYLLYLFLKLLLEFCFCMVAVKTF